MPTHKQATSDIRSRVKSQIADAQQMTVLYDNDPTTQPTVSGKDIWCRASILMSPGTQVEKPHTFRYPGILVLQFFTRIGTGTHALHAASDAAIVAFRNYTTANGVIFRTAYPRPVGRDGDLWQLNTECPFYYDDQTST